MKLCSNLRNCSCPHLLRDFTDSNTRRHHLIRDIFTESKVQQFAFFLCPSSLRMFHYFFHSTITVLKQTNRRNTLPFPVSLGSTVRRGGFGFNIKIGYNWRSTLPFPVSLQSLDSTGRCVGSGFNIKISATSNSHAKFTILCWPILCSSVILWMGFSSIIINTLQLCCHA